MKFLKQFLYMTAVVAALSMTAAAQRDDKQDRPPKDKPPVIDPKDKDRPKDRPKDDKPDRPKKPQYVIFVSTNRTETDSV